MQLVERDLPRERIVAGRLESAGLIGADLRDDFGATEIRRCESVPGKPKRNGGGCGTAETG